MFTRTSNNYDCYTIICNVAIMSEKKNTRPPNAATITTSASTEVKTRRFTGPNSAFMKSGVRKFCGTKLIYPLSVTFSENEMGY